MTSHSESASELSATESRVTLRGAADLADALPYLLGYHPDDSVVLIALHGPSGRVGGRVRADIPSDPGAWDETADQLAARLVDGGAMPGPRPDAAIVFICHEPSDGVSAREAMDRHRPLAQRVRTACGALDVPVFEAIFLAARRYWSYCCVDERCCGAEGKELPPAGTSPMAAAAAYAGLRVRGSLRGMGRRLRPLGEPVAARQVQAFNTVAEELLPRILGEEPNSRVARGETLRLAERLLSRFRRAAATRESEDAVADAMDDALITSEESARLVIGLQDRKARDMVAEWMEGAEGAAALRLWRALSRRCVGEFAEYAVPPLTLAAWVSWSLGDEAPARVALGRALDLDGHYLFARLLHQGCSDGVDPESLRRFLRRQRAARGR
ncbi:DUF4192 domain-containing protein [Streptomyces radicis]|uniref:DUF4192 domain-containing protein n=1 Tax=Streptomyces radicis TaxID=1750517 RepID=A0A3A9W0T3_9ACTN|nr:DUF4192 domain-containing protein [Streptomyces radicis]RKN06835.1 DUF4192 domain-containing protein [Streptomyces radicis]RKN19453.1 DUF4192 domain-containing protein [Streptomyces radicis]